MLNAPGLPQDTEIWRCWFCRQWHGPEKFCPSTLHRRLGIWRRTVKAAGEYWLERVTYLIAIFALGCFAIALAVALAGWLVELRISS